MSERAKLKLEFEILTITNNIETMHKLGKSTAELQSRLHVCRTKLHELKFPFDDQRDTDNSANILGSS
jgi:hypothetical protein